MQLMQKFNALPSKAKRVIKIMLAITYVLILIGIGVSGVTPLGFAAVFTFVLGETFIVFSMIEEMKGE